LRSENSAGTRDILPVVGTRPHDLDGRRERAVDPKANGAVLKSARVEAYPFRYSDARYDSEGLVVHPTRPEILIFTKEAVGIGVYRLDISKKALARRRGQPAILQRHAKLLSGSLATATAISPDGTRLAMRFYFGICEWRLPSAYGPGGAVEGASKGGKSSDILEALRRPPVWIPAPVETKSEGMCYTKDGRALLTVGEGKLPVVFRVRQERGSSSP